jgi:hypothetical protein
MAREYDSLDLQWFDSVQQAKLLNILESKNH